MTNKKEESKDEVLDRIIVKESTANITSQGMANPQQIAADRSSREKPNFPSGRELAKAFATAINQSVMEEARKEAQRKDEEQR